MKTTIEMARESWIDVYGLGHDRQSFVKALEAFAALVREDEAEKHKWDIHSCGPTCKRYACVAMREAVQAEREACAKVCEGRLQEGLNFEGCAKAIRARGQA